MDYMSHRQSFVEFRDKRSKSQRVKQEVFQGGFLSLLLFYYYLSKLPAPSQRVEVVYYAVDYTLMETDYNIDDLYSKVNGYPKFLHH